MAGSEAAIGADHRGAAHAWVGRFAGADFSALRRDVGAAAAECLALRVALSRADNSKAPRLIFSCPVFKLFQWINVYKTV
jgi:hypothetical protein